MSKSERQRVPVSDENQRPSVRQRKLPRISVRTLRRGTSDVSKLGRAIIRLTMAEADAERGARRSHEQAAAKTGQGGGQ